MLDTARRGEVTNTLEGRERCIQRLPRDAMVGDASLARRRRIGDSRASSRINLNNCDVPYKSCIYIASKSFQDLSTAGQAIIMLRDQRARINDRKDRHYNIAQSGIYARMSLYTFYPEQVPLLVGSSPLLLPMYIWQGVEVS